QRVHLGVLVDRAIDLDEQPGLFQRLQMLVQIRVFALAHWTVMPFSRISRLHFAWSLRTRAAIVSAAPPTTSQPWLSNLLLTEESASIAMSEECNCSITERGVAAGANRPTHDSVSKPG